MDIAVRTRADPRAWLIIGLVAAVYCAIYLGLPRLPISPLIKSIVIQAALWVFLAWVIRRLPSYRTAARIKDRADIIAAAFMVGFFQVLFYGIGGLFVAFGKNPNPFTPFVVIQNLVLMSAMLLGAELSRAWLINHMGKGRGFLALAFVSVLYTFLTIPLAQIAMLKPAMESIDFLNSTLLPALAENLLATLFALLAGPKASLAYRATLQSFWWFSPVLPDLSWGFKGIIGTVMPIVGLVMVQSIYSGASRAKQVREGGSPAGWIGTSIISVLIIWFAVGVFPIRPALVPTGSMSPLINPGDIVIVARTPLNKVKVGDIIEFRTPKKIAIVHRVIKVEETKGQTFFITKGDANNTADSDPVPPANIMGKAIMVIPKVGWLAIAVKGIFAG